MTQTRNRLARLVICLIVSVVTAPAILAQSLVTVDGSSTMFPVTEAVAEAFQVQRRGATRVTVRISGTTGGFRKFCRGETDVQDASRPILKAEMQACRAAGVRYFEIPVAFDALTVAVNPRNSWASSLTFAELRKIWEPGAEGKVLRWSDINPKWPNERLALFGPDVDSGTFDYFTEAVIDSRRASRNDYTGSEDDNVIVGGIEANAYAMGYVPYSYYAAHRDRLKALAIDAGAGPITPALENVANRSYPLSRPLFIYVNADSAQRAEVRGFVEFFLTQGPAVIQEVQYLPLSKAAYAMAANNFRQGKLGTAFGGEPQIAVAIEDILVRAAKL